MEISIINIVTKTSDKIGKKRLNRSLSGDNKRNVE